MQIYSNLGDYGPLWQLINVNCHHRHFIPHCSACSFMQAHTAWIKTTISLEPSGIGDHNTCLMS